MVYIAGILPAFIGLTRIEVNSFFRSSMPKADSLTKINRTDECAYGKYGIIHGVKKPIYMEQIDSLIHDMQARNVTCNIAPKCLAKVEGKCVLHSSEESEDGKSSASAKGVIILYNFA